MLYDGAVVQMDKQCLGKDLCLVDHFMDLTGMYIHLYIHLVISLCLDSSYIYSSLIVRSVHALRV